MNPRNWINERSSIATAVALVLLFVALGILVLQSRGRSAAITGGYFYDLGSEQPNPLDRLYPAKVAAIPPLDAPSGKTMTDGTPAGVRAWVYACGDCEDTAQRYIAYLETYTPAAHELLAKHLHPDGTIEPTGGTDMAQVETGHMVASAEDPRWVSIDSEPGRALLDSAQTRCDDPARPAVRCSVGK